MKNNYRGYSTKSESKRNQTNILLPEKDVRYFKRYVKDFQPENWYWGFTCFSRQNYRDCIRREFEDEIIYGIYSLEGGGMAEMTMIWEKIGVDEPCLRSFSESFVLMMSPTHKQIFAKIRKLNNERFSPEEFSKLLISLGFQDDSDFPLKD